MKTNNFLEKLYNYFDCSHRLFSLKSKSNISIEEQKEIHSLEMEIKNYEELRTLLQYQLFSYILKRGEKIKCGRNLYGRIFILYAFKRILLLSCRS